MKVLFNKNTQKRITDFGSNCMEMTEELWYFVEQEFGISRSDVIEADIDFGSTLGKDIFQMIAVIENNEVVSWSAPDFVPPAPGPESPSIEERTTALEDAVTVLMGL